MISHEDQLTKASVHRWFDDHMGKMIFQITYRTDDPHLSYANRWEARRLQSQRYQFNKSYYLDGYGVSPLVYASEYVFGLDGPDVLVCARMHWAPDIYKVTKFSTTLI